MTAFRDERFSEKNFQHNMNWKNCDSSRKEMVHSKRGPVRLVATSYSVLKRKYPSYFSGRRDGIRR